MQKTCSIADGRVVSELNSSSALMPDLSISLYCEMFSSAFAFMLGLSFLLQLDMGCSVKFEQFYSDHQMPNRDE